jgi:hypothetical protein
VDLFAFGRLQVSVATWTEVFEDGPEQLDLDETFSDGVFVSGNVASGTKVLE